LTGASLRRQVVAISVFAMGLALVTVGAFTAFQIFSIALRNQRDAMREAAAAWVQADGNPNEGNEAWSSHHLPGGFEISPGKPPGLEIRPEDWERAQTYEEPVWFGSGPKVVLLYPVEPNWAQRAEAEEHPHAVVVVQATRVTWQQAVRPFLISYLVAISSAAMSVAWGSAFALRRALKPVEEAADQIHALQGSSVRVQLPEVGPREVRYVLVEVNKLLLRLDAAFDAQSRFVSEAAHELRTPVTVLRTELELTLRREREPEVYRESLRRLLATVLDLGRLVEALMALARVDSGQIERGMTEVRVADLLARIARDAPRAAMEIDRDDHLRVHGALLEVCLSNLVRNANLHGGGCTRIAYRVHGRNGVFEVEDDGPGVPPEEREALFGRFVRHRAAPSEGLGLGLALAREIARRHGGDCALEGKPSGGCRAVCTILRHAAEATAETAPVASPPPELSRRYSPAQNGS
jgi:signal transduction histidine kinase